MNSNILSFKSLRFFGAYVTPRLWPLENTMLSTTAASCRQERLARWLLAFHADPNLVDLRRRTPLHHAALQGICFCREICGFRRCKKPLSKIGGAKIWSQGWRIFILNEELKNPITLKITGYGDVPAFHVFVFQGGLSLHPCLYRFFAGRNRHWHQDVWRRRRIDTRRGHV